MFKLWAAMPALLALAIPACAMAEETLNLPAYYAEIGLGASINPSVSTNTFTLSDGVNTASGKIRANFDTSIAAGAELGVAGGWIPQVRIGAAYDYLDAHFSSVNFTGKINGVNTNESLSRSDLAGYGVTGLDSSVHVITASAYYSLPLMGAVRPYFGVGVGPAIIENSTTEFAITGTAGVRAALSREAYIGVRYRYFHVTGPSLGAGVKMDDLQSHSVMFLLGYYLD